MLCGSDAKASFTLVAHMMQTYGNLAPRMRANQYTGLPIYDDGLIGATITKYEPLNDNAFHASWLTLSSLDFGCVLLTQDRDGGFFKCVDKNLVDVAPENLVGQKIESMGHVLWRYDGPHIIIEPGELHESFFVGPKAMTLVTAAWFLSGGGTLYASCDEECTLPAGCIEVIGIDDQTGCEYPVLKVEPPAKDKAIKAASAKATRAARDLAARKCVAACGNFKTEGMADGLCKDCRTVKEEKKRPRVDAEANMLDDIRPTKAPTVAVATVVSPPPSQPGHPDIDLYCHDDDVDDQYGTMM